MNNKRFSDTLVSQDRDPLLDRALGIIRCPNCNMWWTRELAPKYCPECQAKVTDTPGQSCELIVELNRKHGLPITISTCTVCGFEVSCEPESFNNTCPKCWGELKLTQLNGKPVSGKGNSMLKGVFKRIKNCF